MSISSRMAVVATVAVFFLCAGGASAHPLAPVGLELEDEGEGRWHLRLERALVQPKGASFEAVWPRPCTPRGEPVVTVDDDAVTERIVLDCEGDLSGGRLGVAGLRQSGLDAVVRIDRRDGVHRVVLHGADTLVIPRAPSSVAVVRSHLALGVQHMLTGFDHLLFVLALWWLVTGRRLVLALTAFTVGHSLTLAATTLGWMAPPVVLVELLIAASLLVMAVRVIEVHSGESERPGARIWLLTAAFGLLHGFGFAGALREVGLPPGEAPLALAAFNIGVELAQLAVVAAAWLAHRGYLRWARRRREPSDRLRLLPGYALGALAAMWCIERAMAMASMV